MVNRMFMATSQLWIAVASRDLCTKFEAYLPSNNKDITMCICCYGNKVSMTTSHNMDCCCLKGSFYLMKRDHISSNCKVINACLCCHSDKVSIATSHWMDICCFKRSLYQIRSSHTFKQLNYKCRLLLPW